MQVKLETFMTETSAHTPRRETIATRVDRGVLATIERLAAERRTTPSQVARCLLEDGVRAITESAA
jgi:hypothetical protein